VPNKNPKFCGSLPGARANDMVEKRREQRHKLVAQMRVFGMDIMGKPFIETARALNVSPGGIHLAGLQAHNRVGEVIGIQYKGVKVRANVVWVGYPDTTLDGHIGVKVVGNDSPIWQAVQPELENAFALDGEKRPPSIAAGDRRNVKRYACHGSVKVRVPGVGHPVWATITDLSMMGCYLETPAPAALATQVDLIIEIEGHILHAAGEVRGSYPGVGMGVTFTELPERDRKELQTLVLKLAARQGIASSD
jgi:hypothetical protein